MWLSNDGGNQFDLLLTLDSNQTIEHCYVDLHGGKVVFTSNTHKVYYRSAGTRSNLYLYSVFPKQGLHFMAPLRSKFSAYRRIYACDHHSWLTG